MIITLQPRSGWLLCLYSTILGSWTGPVQLIVRCLDDGFCGFRGEKKQACPVLLKLTPPAHTQLSRIDLWLEELPVWENKVGLILAPWLCPCAARMSIIVPIWSFFAILLSRFVGRTTKCINLFSLFQHRVCSAIGMFVKTWSHRTAPSDSWQPVWRRIFVECLEMLTNAQSCWLVFCCDWFPKSLTDTSFGFGAALISDCKFSTCFLCSRSPASHGLLWWPGFRTLVVSLCRKNCHAKCSTPRDTRTEDFLFPGCFDGACTSISTVTVDYDRWELLGI